MIMNKNNAKADALMSRAKSKFRINGISSGVLSAITYGLYSTFVVFATVKEPLAGAVGIFAAPYVASAINDLLAGIWLLIYNGMTGRIREIGRSMRTFPGFIVILGALVGGPIASGAYLMGLAMAGAYAIPISALNVLFGTIFARIILKQKFSPRVFFGMVICIIGAIVINWTTPDMAGDKFYLGIICAFVAAIGWGLEAVLACFGTSVMDSDIAINIRQLVSGVFDIVVILPLVGALGLFSSTIFAGAPLAWLALSGLCAAASYLFWYKSNSMVGCATGMSLNITYVFWGILFSILFLGSQLTSFMIVGSVVIIVGAVLVSMNPLDLFKKGA